MNFILVALWGFGVLLSGVRSDPLETCVPRNSTYKIGDSKQCDKYFECTKGGKSIARLCDDGFVFSIDISDCEYPHNVNCSARPILQPSLSKDPQCPRSNGFYPFPPSDSCQKFYHCLEGQAYEKTCPEGVIFDPAKGACVYPDQSKRPECTAKGVNNFTCPNSLHRFTKLKFGDHDRHSHPKDCRKFFICLKDGKPRVGGCPNGKVFNGKTGFCDAPKRVLACKDYYGKKNPEALADASDDSATVFDGDNEVSDEASSVRQESVEAEDVVSEEDQQEEERQQQQARGNRKPKKQFLKVTKRQAEIAQAVKQGQEGQVQNEEEKNKDVKVKDSQEKKQRHIHKEGEEHTDTSSASEATDAEAE